MRINMTADADSIRHFSPAPDGTYVLQVVDKKDQASKKGDPQVILEMEIAEGPHMGRKVWHCLTFIPRGQEKQAAPGHGMALHALHAFGLPYNGELNFDSEELIGRTARVNLGTEMYTNKEGVQRHKNVILEFLTDDEPEAKNPQASGAPAKSIKQTIREKNTGEGDGLEDVPF